MALRCRAIVILSVAASPDPKHRAVSTAPLQSLSRPRPVAVITRRFFRKKIELFFHFFSFFSSFRRFSAPFRVRPPLAYPTLRSSRAPQDFVRVPFSEVECSIDSMAKSVAAGRSSSVFLAITRRSRAVSSF